MREELVRAAEYYVQTVVHGEEHHVTRVTLRINRNGRRAGFYWYCILDGHNNIVSAGHGYSLIDQGPMDLATKVFQNYWKGDKN